MDKYSLSVNMCTASRTENNYLTKLTFILKNKEGKKSERRVSGRNHFPLANLETASPKQHSEIKVVEKEDCEICLFCYKTLPT